MKKNSRTLKASIVMGILIASLFTAFLPTASAAAILHAQGNLKMEFDANAAKQTVTPLGAPIYIPINVSYLVSGIFAPAVVGIIGGRMPAMIELSVDQAPEWCTALVSPGIVSTEVSTSYKSAQAIVTLSVDENAPAFTQSKVRIKMHARTLRGLGCEISEVTFYDEIPFTPGYSPVISFTTPNGNFKEIGPGNTANFDIHVENLGNAPTEVTFKILNQPKGWSPNIISMTTLGAKVLGEETTKEIPFVVQPPYNFGYHNERQSFQVSLTPAYYRDPTLTGKEYVITFVVQSRGFSTPGFEMVFALTALVGLAFVTKKRQK
ncbi:MAG: hypothetical protein DRN01_04715 [Thermoplasmata archaeon]|nr:MAG: hypothetical protein DRN01_04715 [Thermoplasmata archaeon]